MWTPFQYVVTEYSSIINSQVLRVAICIINAHRSNISPLFFDTMSCLSEISLSNILFSILSYPFDLSFPYLVLCVFLDSDVSLWLLHFLCLNSNLVFQNEISHKLLSFRNFLNASKFLVEILNDIMSALWRALCNISHLFSSKLLTSFLGKILQQLHSDHIFPVGLWVPCESDIYYFPRSLSCQRNWIRLTWVILDKFMLVVFCL